MNEEILTYLESLMGRLGSVFKTDDDQIRGTALSAISSVAIAAKNAFVPYYEAIVTVLVQILNVTGAFFFFLSPLYFEVFPLYILWFYIYMYLSLFHLSHLLTQHKIGSYVWI